MTRLIVVLILVLYIPLTVLSDITKDSTGSVDADSTRVYDVGSIVVTATRYPKLNLDVPYVVNRLSTADLECYHLPRTYPEALQVLPGVMVQKTAAGQGSPFIRGFTGFRTLFLLDGIRLNNSVYRDGPNQYVSTVNLHSVDGIEVVKGPGSVLFGSDAVGGTVNGIVKSRRDYGSGFHWDRHAFLRYSTAEDSYTGRIEVSANKSSRLGVLGAISHSRFGNLLSGGEVGRQPKTGYDQWSGDLRLDYFGSDKSKLSFVHQSLIQDNVWRTHKTIYGVPWRGTDMGTDSSHYFDQTRHLTYVQFRASNLGETISSVAASVSWQVQQEIRSRQKQSEDHEEQGFYVGTFGTWMQVSHESGAGHWTLGAEYYRDNVDSFKKTIDSHDHVTSVSPQGPVADDAIYDHIGLYLQDDVVVANRLNIIAGLRYSYFEVDAGKVVSLVDGSVFGIRKNWDNLTGSLRLTCHFNERTWSLFAGISQAFRAPNLSDLTRFDVARSNEFETPAPGLKPERYLALEVGIRKNGPGHFIETSLFHTNIRDLIVRTPTGRVVDEAYEVTKTNAAEGWVRGVELSGTIHLKQNLTADIGLMLMDGEADAYPTSSDESVSEPIDRLMPPMGHVGGTWHFTGCENWLGAELLWSLEQDKLSTRDASDTQRIPPGGTSGYVVINLRTGWSIGVEQTMTVGLENITNQDYRIHGSGQNEAGINFVVGVSWRL